jgi:hypothetical protein
MRRIEADYGLDPLEGVQVRSWSLDHVGPLMT